MKTLDLITTEELAEMCHVMPNTIRYWRHVGSNDQKGAEFPGSGVYFNSREIKPFFGVFDCFPLFLV
jgi:hypothetical protein